ncbi:hypothetical protein Vi05172_g11982 [Venturia inaequalis]|nr:hypothetical protein Vi05172_g11982 [Venturia inaequalis]
MSESSDPKPQGATDENGKIDAIYKRTEISVTNDLRNRVTG